MKTYFQHLILIASVAVIAAGCASAPSKFYTLDSTAISDGIAATHYAIVVGPVTIPAEVDRPQFTVQTAPNRVAIEEFNRWAEPLNEGVARVVAANLATLLGTARVTAEPPANFDPAYRVTIDVQKFVSSPGKSAQLDALWVIHKTVGGVTLSGHTDASEPVKDKSFDALAAAHSRALVKVSADIAAAIQADAAAKP